LQADRKPTNNLAPDAQAESRSADAGAVVGELALLTEAELEQLVTGFNDTAADYPRDRTTHQLVADQAARTPDRAAVESGGHRLTYAELDDRANRLAHHLRELGAGPGVPVGVCLRRSADLVAALLAVWKAGGAYLPLDPDFPPERLRLYLDDSAAPVVITQTELKSRLPATTARVLDLDADDDAIDARPATPPEPAGTADDLAYLIYTSGSTGTPNGVEVPHRALVNFLTSMRREPGLTPDDVVAAVTTVSFDIHHLELWLPLTTGAKVAVLTREESADGVRLAEELDRVGATVLQATPATWRLLLAAGWAGREGLRALCGGEPMPPDLAAQLLGRVGELWNMYGPTETTVWSTAHRVEDPAGPIPVGKPIANTRVYVLDRNLRPVPVGCVGEVYIGGDGVARGYRNRPELTAGRFVADPFRPGQRMYRTGDLGRFRADGVLECLGRIDHQVKVNGHRIELGEVEAALAKHPAVAMAAARVWGQPPQLAAYVVTRPGEPRSPEPIRQHLRDRLPRYMVPTLITFVDALPLTPNGKIDRRALPDPAPPAAADRPHTPARTDAERDVLAVWTEVFGRSGFGVTDDFFELGGTSLQAGEIVALIRRRLGHTIPLGAMYTATTVEKLAVLIQHRLESSSTAALVPLQVGGSRPPLFIIAGIGGHVFTLHKFARILGPDYTVYGLKAIGVDGDRPPPESFEEIAAEYVREITAACPRGPYLLSGYSIGAHVAVEVALQLQALGHEVPLLISFDMPAPGYPPPLSVPRRLVLHARNLFRRDGGLQYVIRRFRNLGNRILRLLGLEKLLFPRHPSLNALPQEALRDVWVAMQRAARKYRPRGRLEGSVTLFRSEVPLDVWNAVVHTDPYLGWGARATGPVEVHPVSLGHLEMFHDSNIDWLARRVAESIDRAADGRAPAPDHDRAGRDQPAPAPVTVAAAT
jgi:amino acid adenylation domain-containing protein